MALVLGSCHFHSLRTCSSLPIRSFRPFISMENIKPYVENDSVKETRALAAELCRHFYGLGWVSGTGGSITLKVNDPSVPLEDQLIVMAPSGVQKERMVPEDMYILGPDGSVLSSPSSKPAPHRTPKCSECAPLFLKAYTMRKAGAVIHSHGLEACLATMIVPGSSEFRITHMEMIKGIKGHGYHDELVLPIIENSAREYELTDTLADAIAAYPKATAVLVRNHGIYIWGDSWIQAKTQAECYHYLFEAAIRLHQMGLDPADPMHRDLKSRAVNPSAVAVKANGIITTDTSTSTRDDNAYPPVIVLDIEGTTTPISFVTDVLFPYAHDHARSHLTSTYDTEETQNDIRVLREQISEDIKNGVVEAKPVPRDNESSKEAIIMALEANIVAMIKADRKVTALKQFQGHIWRSGYAKGELQGQVFEDVPQALSRWTAAGTKVYIYSSGSREAQRLIFGNTKYGDLRVYLSGYFDTKTGNKRESSSYSEIALSVGVDSPSEITFATDVLAEAIAAKQAGLNAVLLLRPGNVPLPSDHGFPTAKSLLEI